MWQYIVVYIIGILVAVYLLKKCYRFFFTHRTRINRCAGCPGCAINPKQ